MEKVTVETVGNWLEEILARKAYYSKNIDKKKVIETFREQAISGMALPSIDEEFLREKCELSWGDAHLLMREIELRKGHVVHWKPRPLETEATKSDKASSPTNTK